MFNHTSPQFSSTELHVSLEPYTDNFQVIPLSFSTNLDRLNPNIPEWREDIGQVVTKMLTKVGARGQFHNQLDSEQIIFTSHSLGFS